MHKAVWVKDTYAIDSVPVIILSDSFKFSGHFQSIGEVDEDTLGDVIFMTVRKVAYVNGECVEEDLFKIDASYDGYRFARELCRNDHILFTALESHYLCVPVGPIQMYLKVENESLAWEYLRAFAGAHCITKDDYENRLLLISCWSSCRDKMIVCKDNFDRDTVSDVLMATGVYCNEKPDMIVGCFNSETSENYYELVDKNYKLYKYEPQGGSERRSRGSIQTTNSEANSEVQIWDGVKREMEKFTGAHGMGVTKLVKGARIVT